MEMQEKLLSECLKKYQLSPEVITAFRKCPRHKFILQNYSMEEIYSDFPLPIYEDEEFVSTISQPSFVMLMIDMLELRPFHKVLELGAGSGWNAALMSCLVEKVISIEIIPSLAAQTRERLKHLGFHNIEIIYGDGAHGFLPEAPFDRAIFTAGATDLPRAFHQQIKIGGKLLFVLKTATVDYLYLMVKHQNYFEEVSRLPCSFVPMRGEKSAVVEDDLSFLTRSENMLRISPNSQDDGKDSVFSVSYT
jgi:protein-L-isoaspartate(D-aspartate) O-methyltransferase